MTSPPDPTPRQVRLFAALVTGRGTYAGGEWMGLRSAFGSLSAGIVVGITVVLFRLAIWEPISKMEPGERQQVE